MGEQNLKNGKGIHLREWIGTLLPIAAIFLNLWISNANRPIERAVDGATAQVGFQASTVNELKSDIKNCASKDDLRTLKADLKEDLGAISDRVQNLESAVLRRRAEETEPPTEKPADAEQPRESLLARRIS